MRQGLLKGSKKALAAAAMAAALAAGNPAPVQAEAVGVLLAMGGAALAGWAMDFYRVESETVYFTGSDGAAFFGSGYGGSGYGSAGYGAGYPPMAQPGFAPVAQRQPTPIYRPEPAVIYSSTPLARPGRVRANAENVAAAAAANGQPDAVRAPTSRENLSTVPPGPLGAVPAAGSGDTATIRLEGAQRPMAPAAGPMGGAYAVEPGANMAGVMQPGQGMGALTAAQPSVNGYQGGYLAAGQGYAQPGYAQPGYAQPGYAQPGYAQPAYVQSAYAQPAYGQLAYGGMAVQAQGAYGAYGVQPVAAQVPVQYPATTAADGSYRVIHMPARVLPTQGAYAGAQAPVMGAAAPYPAVVVNPYQ